MKTSNDRKKSTTLEAIAQQICDMDTLRRRSSDSADFYDLACWTVEKALDAAYEAGRESAACDFYKTGQFTPKQRQELDKAARAFEENANLDPHLAKLRARELAVELRKLYGRHAHIDAASIFDLAADTADEAPEL